MKRNAAKKLLKMRPLSKSTDPKTGLLKRKFKNNYYLALCFIFPALLLLFVYIARKVYPVGEESVLVLDLNGQYVFYFEALRDFFHGKASLLYSFRRALGGEFLGIFGYYLASPFSFIVALFPASLITEALLTMFVIKTGLCGLTCGFYLKKRHPSSNTPIIIFSTLYALCSYAVVYHHNTMWIDNMIFLPLIIYGIEEFILKGKYKMFVLFLSLSIISNYYIGYMSCIFTAVYYFYYYFSLSPQVRNPESQKNHFLKKTLKMVPPVLLVIGISAVIIWSNYTALQFGKNEFSDPSYFPDTKFDVLDMVSKMYFGSYDTVRPEGAPFIYCGMLTFILAPLFFFMKKVSSREKVAMSVMISFFLISFNTTTLDLIWHGMQKPNWLNFRYSFMLCFLFVLMGYRVYISIREFEFKHIVFSAGAIASVLMIMQKLDYENLPDFESVWASLMFIVVYVLILRGVYIGRKAMQEAAVSITLLVICFEMFCSGMHSLDALDDDVVYSARTGYRNFIDRLTPAVDELREKDGGFYRFEKTVHRKTNDNMALGIFGLSNSTSTLNAKAIQFLNNYGLASESHWSKYLGSTPALDSLLGIKYVISENQRDVSHLYNKSFKCKGDLTIYENPYAKSIAFSTYDNILNLDVSSDESKYINPFERMNATVAALQGKEGTVDIFRKADVSSPSLINLTTSTVEGHKKYTPANESESAYLIYTFTAEYNSPVYFKIPSKYPRNAKLTVNGASYGTYFSTENRRMVYIGQYEVGETVTIRLTLSEDKLYLAENYSPVYYFDEDVFTSEVQNYGKNGFEISEWNETSLYGTINVTDKENTVFTSIPYDEGWVIKVDGKKIDFQTALDCFIAFPIEPGEHTLSMEYRPVCVMIGLPVSVVCAGLFLFICIYDALKARKKRALVPAYSDAVENAFTGSETYICLTENTLNEAHVSDISRESMPDNVLNEMSEENVKENDILENPDNGNQSDN